MADNRLSMENLKAMAMTELGNWITEGTAQRGWYTCEMTGKKMRGDVAIAQFDVQAETIQAMREKVEALIEEEERAADAEEQQSKDEEYNNKAVEVLTEAQNIEAYDGITDRLMTHLETRMDQKGIKLVDIKCEDCGAPRTIKVQDQFQVKRCVNCQKKHRNKVRAERRRQKRQEEKAAQDSK